MGETRLTSHFSPSTARALVALNDVSPHPDPQSTGSTTPKIRRPTRCYRVTRWTMNALIHAALQYL